MKLLTKANTVKMLKNQACLKKDNIKPVVKLFTPTANCTWLLSELDPDNNNIAFGLCDLGMGCAELGYVSIAEITAIVLPFGLGVERDRYWTPDKTLIEYAEEARNVGRIIA